MRNAVLADPAQDDERVADKHFGRMLREARKAKGMTCKTLAAKAGVSESYLAKLENFLSSPPSLPLAVRLATALGEDPDVWAAMTGRLTQDVKEIIYEHPAQTIALLRTLVGATASQISAVVGDAAVRLGRERGAREHADSA